MPCQKCETGDAPHSICPSCAPEEFYVASNAVALCPECYEPLPEVMAHEAADGAYVCSLKCLGERERWFYVSKVKCPKCNHAAAAHKGPCRMRIGKKACGCTAVSS
jgi:hypothetical protein